MTPQKPKVVRHGSPPARERQVEKGVNPAMMTAWKTCSPWFLDSFDWEKNVGHSSFRGYGRIYHTRIYILILRCWFLHRGSKTLGVCRVLGVYNLLFITPLINTHLASLLGFIQGSTAHPFQLSGENLSYQHHPSPTPPPPQSCPGSPCVLFSLPRLGTTHSVQIMRRSEFLSYLPLPLIYTHSGGCSPISASFPL